MSALYTANRRYTAHEHSASGTYYVFDNLNSTVVSGGHYCESQAWDVAIRKEDEWGRECWQHEREERSWLTRRR